MGSLQSFQGFSAAKLHELQILISLALHNETVVTSREVLWMQKVTQQLCIWWGCWGPSHQPATRRVAFFNAPLLVSLNTSSLLVCLTLKDSQEQNTLLFCPLSRFSSLLLLIFCSISVLVKLGLVKAQATYFWDKQISRDSCQVCGFFSIPFLLGKEERPWTHELRHTPLLVAGDSRTAGVLETNQFDSILQALVAFLTSVLKI